MKNLILFILALSSITISMAQINIEQSSPDIKWQTIENDFVEVIYPDYLKSKAVNIANYVEHFARYVGKSYQIKKPLKYSIIVRAEGAILNGFVTLAPRRSEFFELNNFTPLFGTSDFLNLLSIHEYRHIIQLDYSNQGYNEYLYYLLGDTGRFVGSFLTTDSWFREGDAVWAETKYTATGRGRTPRFIARLRAILSAGYIPSYDNLLAGDFEMAYPSQYVWGYILVSRLINKYGEDIWAKIIKLTTDKFYWPWRFYNAFEEITGESFEDFFKETMLELQKGFQAETPFDGQKIKKGSYTNYYWPKVSGAKLYALRQNLDSYVDLIEISTKKKKLIKNLNISPNLSRPDLKGNIFVYTQILPDKRYFYKSYSDIFKVNLKNKKQTQLSFNKRYFNLSINQNLEQVAAIGYDDKNHSVLDLINLNTGKREKRIKRKKGYVLDLSFIDEVRLALIYQDELANRSIEIFNVQTNQIEKVLLEKTKNNIFALTYSDGSLYFEADFNGRVENFALNLENQKFSLCSKAKIAHYQPFVYEDKRYFTAELANGRELKNEKLNCEEIDQKNLRDEFLSMYSASDHYTHSKPEKALTKEVLASKEYKDDSYSQAKNLIQLNNWSFFGGRGIQLQGDSRNNLGDFTSSATIGRDAEEQRNFGILGFSYAKFYPIFSFQTYYSERNVQYTSGDNDEFTEANTNLAVTLPYLYKKNLFNFQGSLSLGAGEIHVSNRSRNSVDDPSGDQLKSQFSSLNLSWTKDLTSRQLAPSLGVNYNLFTSKVIASEVESLDNFLFHHSTDFYLPSLWKNHGLKLSLSQERQRDSETSYRISTPVANSEYVFSRGYQYEYTGYFEKISLNYFAPLAYIREGLSDYAFFYRIHGNLFYDSTKINYLDDEYSLNSSGIELNTDSLLFRKLPLTLSYRYMYLNEEDEIHSEIFIGTSL